MRLKRSGKQSGFTIIEVMIAVALLAIGLLAIGGGELTVLQSSRAATNTMKATAAAEYMIELVRRNSDNLLAYNNINTTTDAFSPAISMQNFDFNDWKSQITDPVLGIPGANGRVAIISGGKVGASQITIARVGIFWPTGPAIPANDIAFLSFVPVVPPVSNGIIFTTNIQK